MTYVYLLIVIILPYSLVYIFSTNWEVLATATKKNTSKLNETYQFLKGKNIRCKLSEQDIFINDTLVNLVVNKKDIQKAKTLMEQQA
ncbi:MAG: hypothetical protein ACK4M9_14145 [Anaerobacillus sp.]|uniref:hypothetical protein n=1 Tax=Anaerobacillus sp. TaxID=1872506 RepID=UPI00391AE2B6